METQSAVGQSLVKAEPKTLIWSEPQGDGGRAVIKIYRHRACYDPLRRCLVPYRAQREYELLAHLRQRGVPCPEPLWWSRGRNAAHGRHELLATREIPGTIPLADALRTRLPDLEPLFRLARRMHECGVTHGAFYPANILLSLPPMSAPAYHVIDLAHGCRFPAGIVGSRPAQLDLLDMLRAIERLRPLQGCERWVAGYGLDAGGRRELLRQLVLHRIERPWRHLHRAETDLRAALARISWPAANRASAAATQSRRHMRPG